MLFQEHVRNPISSSSAIVLLIAIAGFAIAARAMRFDTASIADAIPLALEDLPRSDQLAADVSAFYDRRDGAPAWVVDRRGEAAAQAVEAIGHAPAHGLDPAAYDADGLRAELTRLFDGGRDDADRAAQLAALDVRITTALLRAGRHAALGRTMPDSIDRRWTAQRTPPDFVAALDRLAATGDIATWFDAVRPAHPEYAALQRVLADLRNGGEADDRIRQVEMNLDRWRWMPDDLGSRHFLVNIPAYVLLAREDGRVVEDMRVVVGKRGQETPVFSEDMATVVMSPYWHVPESIVEGETAPAAARDSGYLERNAIDVMRVTKSGTERVDPTKIDWDDADALRGLAFRQRPGPHNALGHVKFLFPNPYNVYLHDTPSDSLFARPSRAFSHGCIRVEEPEVLAQYVLRDQPDWTAERIKKAMYSGVEQAVKLPSPIPVHIVYFTVWVAEDGVAQFYPDVYGHDAKQLKGLTAPRKLS